MKKRMRGISRIDSKSTHGWYVRIYADGGVFNSKLFSDRQFGGKKKALEGAIVWRDHNEMVAQLYKAQHATKKKRVPIYRNKPKNNSSGIIGVHTVHSTVKGKTVIYVQATWRENGKSCSKKFYVTKKRTLEEAFEQAVALRKQKEQELLEAWQTEENP